MSIVNLQLSGNPQLTFGPIATVDPIPKVNSIYIVDPTPPTHHAICHGLRRRSIEALPLVLFNMRPFNVSSCKRRRLCNS